VVATTDGSGVPETPERILMRGTLDADLQAALDELPDAFRQAVWLRDVEEFSYAEIAEMLSVPIGTVMSRISRGRRALFERLSAPAAPVDAEVAGGRR
jgi:RNA polymerase sigma-70 factor (ECF subfamily)